jgi:hypothetical protein
LADHKTRTMEGIPKSRKVNGESKKLGGVLDITPKILEIMPTIKELKLSQQNLEKRLKKEGRYSSPNSVLSVYARGDGNDTPLGLKETLEFLQKRLNQISNK